VLSHQLLLLLLLLLKRLYPGCPQACWAHATATAVLLRK
jgi:hypothetical protein